MRICIVGLALGSLLSCAGARSEVQTRPATKSKDRVPSCSPTEAEAMETKLGEIDDAIEALREGDDPAPLEKSLAEAWKHPCLAHVSRFFSPPQVRTAAALKEWEKTGALGALQDSVGGLDIKAGERRFWLLPQGRPTLDSKESNTVSSFLCADGGKDAKACSVAGSYILRAEVEAPPAPRPTHEEDCAHERAAWDGPAEQRPTVFEAWVLCEIDRAERRERFPEGRFKAPTQGWLLLRGRRGHYRFSDDLRAYDLSTDAAYVAQSESALVLQSGGTVDFAQTDRARTLRTFTGRVSAGQVRELAFILLLQKIPELRRVKVQSLAVPANVPFTLSPQEDDGGFGGISGGASWATTAQTTLTWTLLDQNEVKGTGTLTWPNSSDPMEDHADGLLHILEAGLIEGCAPAPLPALAQAAPPTVSRRDADPGKLDVTEASLTRALAGLSGRACRAK